LETDCLRSAPLVAPHNFVDSPLLSSPSMSGQSSSLATVGTELNKPHVEASEITSSTGLMLDMDHQEPHQVSHELTLFAKDRFNGETVRVVLSEIQPVMHLLLYLEITHLIKHTDVLDKAKHGRK
jgi:hypothetical protein